MTERSRLRCLRFGSWIAVEGFEVVVFFQIFEGEDFEMRMRCFDETILVFSRVEKIQGKKKTVVVVMDDKPQPMDSPDSDDLLHA